MTEEIEEFIVDFKAQREWGWLIVIAFFLAGVGAGLFLLSQLLERWANLASTGVATLGLIIVTLGTSGAFLLDLGRRDRFWRALARPLSSWISRGVVFMVTFVLFGALYLAPRWFEVVPWGDTGLAQGFWVLTILAAVGLMAYSGFVLCHSPSIAFWNSTLLPVLFILYALMGGLAAIFALLPALADRKLNLSLLEAMEIWLIISALVLLSVYLLTMAYSTSGARKAVQVLLRGELALPFVGGVVFLGLGVPLAISLYTYFAGLALAAASVALVIVGILELFGGFLFRHTFLRAGIYAPVV